MEFTGHRWIPLTKASDAELWYFPWSTPEQTVEQTIKTPVIWDAHGAHYDVIVMIIQTDSNVSPVSKTQYNKQWELCRIEPVGFISTKRV